MNAPANAIPILTSGRSIAGSDGDAGSGAGVIAGAFIAARVLKRIFD